MVNYKIHGIFKNDENAFHYICSFCQRHVVNILLIQEILHNKAEKQK